MVCSIDDCEAMHWTGHPLEDAERLGWRHHRDGKQPQLSVAIALCPQHAARAAEFRPAEPKRGAR